MKLTTCLIVVCILLSSCESEPKHEKKTGILGLASPIQLGLGSTEINLQNYFLHPHEIDSVSADIGGSLTLNESNLTVVPDRAMSPASTIDFWIAGEKWSIPVMKSRKVEHVFTYKVPDMSFKQLRIKGEMNSWNINANPLHFKESDNTYFCSFITEPGQYQYKMEIDGAEFLDWNNTDSVSNGMGGFNSLMQIGPVGTGENLFLEAKLKKDEIVFHCPEAKGLVLLCDNERVEVTREGDYYRCNMPPQASKSQRSYLRAWAFNEGQLSNDVLLPLSYGKPVLDVTGLTREDKHAMTLYNVFVDRFHNGDTSNDEPIMTGTVLPLANNMGGDIKGLLEKLEEGYFESLGINTIWISPIVKNVKGPYGKWPEPETEFSAYHGYWPISFTAVDERLSTEQDLHDLVRFAHSKDMNVLLDFVANHVHEEHPFYKSDTTVGTQLYLPDGRLNTELWDEHRLTTWFDVFLPSLRLDDPRVYETVTDSCVYWIEKYDFDGFRHDAAKHVPTIFWETLTRKLKERVVQKKGKSLYQIGETYGSRELVASYVNSAQLDAQFDFNVYDAMVSALAREDGSLADMDKDIKKSLDYFGHHHLMGNITGNQDRARFISYAGAELSFEEHPKVAGWTREIGTGPESSYDKTEQLMALVSTVPGIPVVYYGDEIGSCGGGDPDNRKMMQFTDLSDREAHLREATSSLLRMHQSELALMYGDMRTHHVATNSYAFSRNYMGQSVLILMNSSDEPKVISLTDCPEVFRFKELEGMNGHLLSPAKSGGMVITLPANSYEILKSSDL